MYSGSFWFKENLCLVKTGVRRVRQPDARNTTEEDGDMDVEEEERRIEENYNYYNERIAEMTTQAAYKNMSIFDYEPCSPKYEACDNCSDIIEARRDEYRKHHAR